MAPDIEGWQLYGGAWDITRISKFIDELIEEHHILLAKEAARGEVFESCPHCQGKLGREGIANRLYCWGCHNAVTEPAYYQRIPAPEVHD